MFSHVWICSLSLHAGYMPTPGPQWLLGPIHSPEHPRVGPGACAGGGGKGRGEERDGKVERVRLIGRQRAPSAAGNRRAARGRGRRTDRQTEPSHTVAGGGCLGEQEHHRDLAKVTAAEERGREVPEGAHCPQQTPKLHCTTTCQQGYAISTAWCAVPGLPIHLGLMQKAGT